VPMKTSHCPHQDFPPSSRPCTTRRPPSHSAVMLLLTHVVSTGYTCNNQPPWHGVTAHLPPRHIAVPQALKMFSKTRSPPSPLPTTKPHLLQGIHMMWPFSCTWSSKTCYLLALVAASILTLLLSACLSNHVSPFHVYH
jgi:hypothetical protein